MSIDHSAAALSAALRTFGESLGRALAEGITRGVQEGLSQSLDLEQLATRVPRRAAEEGTQAAMRPAPRRGGRPRGEVRACRIAGCTDPARSRGLCSRHYQQELRREKSGETESSSHFEARPQPAAPAVPVEAKPPMVRKRPDHEQAVAPVASAAPAARPPHGSDADSAARVIQEHLRSAAREEPRSSVVDAAKRIFG